MSRSSELDGVDFRPFFDMVVGILFVLLILVGALIFFQQTQDGVIGSPEQSELRRWRLQRSGFLERLAGELRGRGLSARADIAAGTVLTPLAELADVGGTGLPGLKAEAVAGLAGALAPAVGCVAPPRGVDPACGEVDLLALDGLSVQVRLGAVASEAGLRRERAARYLAASLSAALYQDSPELLRASDTRGNAALAFDDGTIGDGRSGGPGDLALVFGFARPPQ